jgi:hypothetical protein
LLRKPTSCKLKTLSETAEKLWPAIRGGLLEIIMAELLLHNVRINSIFELLGYHENDISYSVAWALSNSPNFLTQLLKHLKITDIINIDDIKINLQYYEKDYGITDIEIELYNHFHIIVEAKRGWVLPSKEQLTKYSKRKSFKDSDAKQKLFVVLSECSYDYAIHNMEILKINDIDIIPISWANLCKIAIASKNNGSHKEKHLLDDLSTYFRGLITMQNIESNLVYVVSISSDTPDGWDISWIDIVEKKRKYFHPMGGSGWPKEPPNYIAFRYHGALQSIHHIENYEVVNDLHDSINEIPSENNIPHFVYKLSKPFRPEHEVKTGKLYRNGRVWCMLDTLFLCKTISEARDLTKKRQL